MKFRAYAIKTWIMMEISPMGWASLITRAMPELLEHNNKFSAYYISERTSWSEMEVDIINWYLRKMYKMELPSEVLTSNVYLKINYMESMGYSFFETSKKWKRSAFKLLSFFRTN
ncbi:hypothetical protein [Ekhidna sp.]|uniref:hypothetical protein n=1 Tax=Ekhidna sp. TaxID=2608089 RepID=UPI003297ECD3